MRIRMELLPTVLYLAYFYCAIRIFLIDVFKLTTIRTTITIRTTTTININLFINRILYPTTAFTTTSNIF